MQAVIPATAVNQPIRFSSHPPPFLIRPDISRYLVQDEVDQDTFKISESVFDLDVQTQAATTLMIDSLKKVEIAEYSSSNHTKIIDIDADLTDPLLCRDIAGDMFHNLKRVEAEKRPRTDYMEKVQKHINPRTRARFVDWLVGAAEILCYTPETLHLAINYLDRYLSGNAIDYRYSSLHLVGLTCMMIASKYEEVRTSNGFDFGPYISLAINTFSRSDFARTENAILSYLEYEMAVPTTWSFLGRYIRAALGGPHLECMAKYLADVSLLSYSMLRYLPSLIAASSVFLARYVLDPLERPWNCTLQHYTAYRASDLRDCVLALYAFCYKSSSSNMPSIRVKYRREEYDCVALKNAPPSIPPHFFYD